MMIKKISILGTRGVPAQHGGFETFAEYLALHLVARGWDVEVYCQAQGTFGIRTSNWEGIKCLNIAVATDGAAGSVIFDWKAALNAKERDRLFLTLGYNTAIFNLIQRVRGQYNIINMDGIEWKRKKWGRLAKSWFWLNELIGCKVGNMLIADHPQILLHLQRWGKRKEIAMIPYGAEDISQADDKELVALGLHPGSYSVLIARPEPENSILEIVQAFSSKRREHHLVVLGNFDPARNQYHAEVKNSASSEVIFAGAIYSKKTLAALRKFCQYYLHGHTVGGTNPSLVEAMGAGCAVIAHDNRFNRWVAGRGACYFADAQSCEEVFNRLVNNEVERGLMSKESKRRYLENFTWTLVLNEYEKVLNKAWLEKFDAAVAEN